MIFEATRPSLTRARRLRLANIYTHTHTFSRTLSHIGVRAVLLPLGWCCAAYQYRIPPLHINMLQIFVIAVVDVSACVCVCTQCALEFNWDSVCGEIAKNSAIPGWRRCASILYAKCCPTSQKTGYECSLKHNYMHAVAASFNSHECQCSRLGVSAKTYRYQTWQLSRFSHSVNAV